MNPAVGTAMLTEAERAMATTLYIALHSGTQSQLRRAVQIMTTEFTAANLPLTWRPASATLWGMFLLSHLEDVHDNAALVATALHLFLDAADCQRFGANELEGSPRPRGDRSSEAHVGANLLMNRPCFGWRSPLILALMRHDELLARALLSLPTERADRLLLVDTVEEEPNTDAMGCDALHIALSPSPSSHAVICALIDRTRAINGHRMLDPSRPISHAWQHWRAYCTPLSLARYSYNWDAILYMLHTRWMDLDFATPCRGDPTGRTATPWQLLFSSPITGCSALTPSNTGCSALTPSKVAAAWNQALHSLTDLSFACAHLLPSDLAAIVTAYLILNKPATLPRAPPSLLRP